jgi:methionine-rich copper-binding protein CopC
MRIPRRIRAAGLAAALVALAVGTALAPHPALAHARYKSSTPGKGEVLATSPPAVEIVFTQNVQKVAGAYGIAVNRDRGGPVTSSPPTLDDADRSKMSVPLQPNLPAGRYVVNWKNVSDDDGDPLEGAFSFYVAAQPTTVDLANDQQLAQVGANLETAQAGTPGAGSTPPATARPGVTGTAAATAASPTAVPASSGSGGGSNTGLFIGIGVAVAIVLIAGGGWFTFMRGGR